MVRVAIVEDNASEAETLKDNLARYESEVLGKETFEFFLFPNAMQFIIEKNKFDLIFMDIDMPEMSGLDAAAALRKTDDSAVLVFVTNLAQFAVNGYEVNAMDFLVKPVGYARLKPKMERILHAVSFNSNLSVAISKSGNLTRVDVRDILYVKVMSHSLIYHCANRTIEGYGTLSREEERLAQYDFMRCNSCFLVNPRAVTLIEGQDITLKNGEILRISRMRKKTFMENYLNWTGKNL